MITLIGEYFRGIGAVVATLTMMAAKSTTEQETKLVDNRIPALLVVWIQVTWKTANLGLYIVSYKLRSSTVVGENVAGVWNGW